MEIPLVISSVSQVIQVFHPSIRNFSQAQYDSFKRDLENNLFARAFESSGSGAAIFFETTFFDNDLIKEVVTKALDKQTATMLYA